MHGIITIITILNVPFSDELKDTFECCAPKVVFCQSSKVQTVQQALDLIKMSAQVIAFDESKECLTFSKFLDEYGEDLSADDFRYEFFIHL